MNVGQACFDEAGELELMAAFGNLDGAKLSCPLIDILEQMPVNGLQVR